MVSGRGKCKDYPLQQLKLFANCGDSKILYLSLTSNLKEAVDQIWGKTVFIVVHILKGLFLFWVLFFFFSFILIFPSLFFSDSEQSFIYLLGYLHFKDMVRYTSSRDRKRKCKFYPRRFTTFWVLFCQLQLKCSSAIL